MVDRRRGARFVEEPLAEPVVVPQLRREDLQGDPSLHADMLGGVDDGHAAALQH